MSQNEYLLACRKNKAHLATKRYKVEHGTKPPNKVRTPALISCVTCNAVTSVIHLLAFRDYKPNTLSQCGIAALKRIFRKHRNCVMLRNQVIKPSSINKAWNALLRAGLNREETIQTFLAIPNNKWHKYEQFTHQQKLDILHLYQIDQTPEEVISTPEVKEISADIKLV